MKFSENDVEVELIFVDGFPEINIQTSTIGHKNRPAVQVELNNVVIHQMFDSPEDERWNS